MTEEEQSPEGERRCLVCQVTSEERVLLYAVKQNQDVWVCVGCLPRLIHGAH